MSILLLGIGNIIMGDDGIGPHLINRMRNDYIFMPGIMLLDGGTLGLDLLHYLQGITCLVIVDAFDMAKLPGHLQRFEDDDVPAALSATLSAHQSGLQDLLALADLQGYLPQRIVLWGVQPQAVSLSLELSPAVAECMDELVLKLLGELKAWGIGYERKGAAEAADPGMRYGMRHGRAHDAVPDGSETILKVS
jgi:hydrogenase maturation protease